MGAPSGMTKGGRANLQRGQCKAVRPRDQHDVYLERIEQVQAECVRRGLAFRVVMVEVMDQWLRTNAESRMPNA